MWYLYHAQVKIVLGTGNKRDKNPWMLSDANYASKTKNAGLPGIDYDPRPVKYRLVTPDHINHFATNLQIILQHKWSYTNVGNSTADYLQTLQPDM